MNHASTQLEPDVLLASPRAGSPATGNGGARFTYASGSRPLAGYTLKRGIGHGGFGEVYFATSDAGKEVALKLIRRNLDVELRGVTQCLNLKHPNLLALFDVREDDQGDSWVVMELMTGPSLEQVLEQHSTGLPEQDVLAWMHGIAAGVAYLHDHGIVHRDLKPGNIFTDEGLVKIGDYGLSKFISASRRSGQTGSIGTVHYMAPEVANGRYGKEIDIYALGIMLYEMLTGHVPFEGESIGEVLMKHLTAEPDVSKLAEPYRTLVARALAKDPQHRLRSVQELIALLPPPPRAGNVPNHAGWPGLDRREAPANPQENAAWALPVNEAVPPLVPPNRGFAAAAPVPASPSSPLPTAQSLPAMQYPEEPIWRWVVQTRDDLVGWWERKNFHAWQKLLIVLVGVFAAINLAPLWMPFLFTAAVCYGIYRLIRAIVVQKTPTTSQPPVQPQFAAAHATPAQSPPVPDSHTARKKWRHRDTLAHQSLVKLTPRERGAAITGAMLLAALVAAVVSLVMLVVRGQHIEPTQFAWLALCGTVGSWLVIVPAKLWEGQRGEAALRRFTMMVLGLCLGAFAWLLMDWLMVPLTYETNLYLSQVQLRLPVKNFYGIDGSPSIYAFLAYFGFLFLIPRWWLQAESRRTTRLSVWHTAVVLFWAAALNVFWPFPQPWGFMLTATMAIAVQLASPWEGKRVKE